ncbi:MAG TPA: BlaI/MecI/CopY family transcriptional regulator [Planctomycetota bacterium]|nr:BlaI/MecI/CopY family transcriptional regulator [Planctomycetota bacterium]
MSTAKRPRRDPESGPLSELQLAILNVLWQQPGATVLDVHGVLRRTRSLTPSTVATVLTRLEARGVVERSKRGRQFCYTARVSHERASETMLDDLAQRVFGGDAAALVCRLIESEAIGDDELDRVSRLIAERRRQNGATNHSKGRGRGGKS